VQTQILVLHIIGWVVGVAGALLFTLFALMNASVAYRILVLKKRASFVPFVGGFVGLLSILALPVVDLRHAFWVPFVLDSGSIPMLFVIAAEKIRQSGAGWRDSDL
jgi:hypothetical protein